MSTIYDRTNRFLYKVENDSRFGALSPQCDSNPT